MWHSRVFLYCAVREPHSTGHEAYQTSVRFNLLDLQKRLLVLGDLDEGQKAFCHALTQHISGRNHLPGNLGPDCSGDWNPSEWETPGKIYYTPPCSRDESLSLDTDKHVFNFNDESMPAPQPFRFSDNNKVQRMASVNSLFFLFSGLMFYSEKLDE